MPRFITRGKFTRDYVKSLVGAPEDREQAVKKLVEAAGGKFVSFYFTTGDTDFMLIAEGEADSVIAGMMVAGAAGTITDIVHRAGVDRLGIQADCRTRVQGNECVSGARQRLE